MEIAKTALNNLLLAIFVLLVALSLPKSVGATAGSPQNCVEGETCTIGEFLFDDGYTPIATGSCRMTSKDPTGTTFINNVLMDYATEDDGWYYHEFTTPTTTGYYRTDVCCTVDTEYLCIDKSFEAVATSADSSTIAAAVWGYSNRTLSSFGSLASDVWSFSTRSLSSFGSLISDIWGHSSRTLTDSDLNSGESIATKSDLQTSSSSTVSEEVESIKETASANRLLLEQLANKPIIQYFLEEENPDLGSKLKETRAVANQLFVNNQYITSKVGNMVADWDEASYSETLDSLIELNELLGEESVSSSTDTIFGSINWIKGNWDWQEVSSIERIAKAVGQSLVSVRTNVASTGTLNFSSAEVKGLLTTLLSLEETIGAATDISSSKTLYGKIQQTEEIASVLDTRQDETERMLSDWDAIKSKEDTKSRILDLKRKVLAINKVPKGSLLVESQETDAPADIVMKNSLLSTRGLIITNKLLLSKGVGSYLSASWLEEGSIVIKSVIINPSKLINQDAELKYYLPPEVREEDVISTESPLTIKYDIEKDQYYIDATIPLLANETKIYRVRLNDIWVVTQEEVDSLRSQANDLSKPLDGTSYFAQGVTLKSDIDASLDKILTLQKGAITPEQRIRAYREAMIEKVGVDEKIAKLQDLLALASSTGTLFGFVGGVSALAVWGLIIIMITGFVFLVVYMRKAIGPARKKKAKKDKVEDEEVPTPKKRSKLPGLAINRKIGFIIAFLVFGAIVATVSGLIVARSVSNSTRDEVADVQNGEGEEEAEEVAEEEGGLKSVGGLEIVRINVPELASLNVKESSSPDSKIILMLSASIEAIKIGEEGDLVRVAFDKKLAPELTTDGLSADQATDEDTSMLFEGWVHKNFVEGAPSQSSSETADTDTEESAQEESGEVETES